MNIVITGHVDHGKSTIIGRLLADTDSLPEGKLEQIRQLCQRNSKPFEYAFLLDALKEEQSQGITIDSARCFFKSKNREYMIIDAPGHIEFLKNMITGASHAEAALLVIDANEGIMENSRRHGYMLSLLEIKQVAILVNKMDLVNYSQDKFDEITRDYQEYLHKIHISPTAFIPVSGFQGDNIASLSENMAWYRGGTVLEILDNFKEKEPLNNKPFRMPVQGIYKFTKGGDNRRIVAGTIESGSIKKGDKIVFYPLGKNSTINSLEAFNKSEIIQFNAQESAGFTLNEQIYISRGNMAAKIGEKPPLISSIVKANLFWLGKKPMELGRDYILKMGTARHTVRLEKIISVLDASKLENKEKEKVEKNDVAQCIIHSKNDLAFDLPQDIINTSRFVIVDDYEISGGGIIIEALEDERNDLRNKVIIRNKRWIKSGIAEKRRAQRFNQKAALILMTGPKEKNRKSMATHLERALFNRGNLVYFLAMRNLIYGIDADLTLSDTDYSFQNGSEFTRAHADIDPHKPEHFRRLAEMANIMLDSGMILIVSLAELENKEKLWLETAINHDKIITVWLGQEPTKELEPDILIGPTLTRYQVLNKILDTLVERKIVFR